MSESSIAQAGILDAPSANEGRRLALVVGVNGPAAADYLAPLLYAESDAAQMAKLLGGDACRFNLVDRDLSTSGAEAQDLKRALLRLARDSTKDDFLLVYFSGHAQQIPVSPGRNEVFLVTVDFDPRDAKDDPESFLSLSWLYDKLYVRAAARYVLLLLDCCYAGNWGATGPDPLKLDLGKAIEDILEGNKTGGNALEGRFRGVLSAAGYDAKAYEVDGHGQMTRLLLPALKGEVEDVLDERGNITFMSLGNYVQQLAREQDTAIPAVFGNLTQQCILAYYPDHSTVNRQQQTELRHRQERRARLEAMLVDHSSFLQNRLESFVGREEELKTINALIAEVQPGGGYITITGQAGQGKSSIIARLVSDHDPATTPHHFILLNPGSDYQLIILRDIMAQLILKYDLPELYVAGENRRILADYFPKVLNEVANQGGQEVIFIDGLDQLEEDLATRTRDLSFLPRDPTPGIVIVLGTRPNDTLRPLVLLKPHHEYLLPHLSRPDFDRILAHRGVHLDVVLADQFYSSMQRNALYLDLVARELAQAGALDPEKIIQRVADDPVNLFSFAVDRFKRHEQSWEVIHSILGVLLAAQEPLLRQHIGQITKHRSEKVREALQRLGGLVPEDGQQRYSLYHLKFRDFLREDPERPNKESLFEAREEAAWHQVLADWCASGGLGTIWQDKSGDAIEQLRRDYARKHYVTHLYHAGAWERLEQTLDEGEYGHAKIQHDPSTRAYAQDLDLGRAAAARSGLTFEERLSTLPNLWRYTLLRCSLSSRADQYPDAAFTALVLLGREAEAIGLAELLTDDSRKVKVLTRIVRELQQQSGREQESALLLLRAYDIARQRIREQPDHRSFEVLDALADVTDLGDVEMQLRLTSLAKLAIKEGPELWYRNKLVNYIAREKLLNKAVAITQSIADVPSRAHALMNLAALLNEGGQAEIINSLLDEAERLAHDVVDGRDRIELLAGLASQRIALGDRDQLEGLLGEAERLAHDVVDERDRIELLAGLATQWVALGDRSHAEGLLAEAASLAHSIDEDMKQILAIGFAEVGNWGQAEKVAWSIANRLSRYIALGEIARQMGQLEQWEGAEKLVRAVIHDSQGDVYSVYYFFRKHIAQLAKAGQWDRAEELARSLNEAHMNSALVAFGEELAKAGQWDRAEELARSLDKTHMNSALIQLGEELAKAGQWDRAEELARSIDEDYFSDKLRLSLTVRLAEAKQWERAEQTARSIEANSVKIEALGQLAEWLVATGTQESATQIMTEIASLTRTSSDPYSDTSVFWYLLPELAATKHWNLVEGIVRSIQDPSALESALEMLVVERSKAGQVDEAEALARTMQDPEKQASAYMRAALELARAQEWDHVEQVVKMVSPPLLHFGTLIEIAGILIEQGQRTRARADLAEIERQVNTIEDALARATFLAQISSKLLDINERSTALSLLSQAFELAQTEGEEREWVIATIMDVFISAREWDQAEHAAGSITDLIMRPYYQVRIIDALAHAGEWAHAEQILGYLPDVDRSRGLRHLARAATATGQQERFDAIGHFAQSTYDNLSIERGVVEGLIDAKDWAKAEAVALGIDSNFRDESLRDLAQGLAKEQLWQDADRIIRMIPEQLHMLPAASTLVEELISNGQTGQALELVQWVLLRADTRDEATDALRIVSPLIRSQPDLGPGFVDGLSWVTHFLER
jgi:hypothetical protein